MRLTCPALKQVWQAVKVNYGNYNLIHRLYH